MLTLSHRRVSHGRCRCPRRGSPPRRPLPRRRQFMGRRACRHRPARSAASQDRWTAHSRGSVRSSPRGSRRPADGGRGHPRTPPAGIRLDDALAPDGTRRARGALAIVVLRRRRPGPAARVARESAPIISGDALLPDNTDLLRECQPSIGNAYTTVAADIVVRHRRQRGDEAFFLTGVDEHSTRVYRVAQEQGLDPYEYLDQIALRWKELPERLNASIDFFIRTSDEGTKVRPRLPAADL